MYVRYADDFVILSPEKEWLEIAIKAIVDQISEMGLKIKQEKTRMLYTLPPEKKERPRQFNI